MKLLTMLSAALLASTVVMAETNDSSEPKQDVKLSDDGVKDLTPPSGHHKADHHKMDKAAMKKACEEHVANAEKMVGDLKDAKHKALGEIHVGMMKNAVAGYDKFEDSDHKALKTLDSMCSWNLKKVEALHKQDARHAEKEAKKAEKEAKKAEKEAKKEEVKEEKKDEKKEESK